jgi:hypothetical protein
MRLTIRKDVLLYYGDTEMTIPPTCTWVLKGTDIQHMDELAEKEYRYLLRCNTAMFRATVALNRKYAMAAADLALKRIRDSRLELLWASTSRPL